MNPKAKRRTNIRSGDWKAIARHIKKRGDRRYTVYLDGQALSTEKVQRGKYRNFPTIFKRLQEDSCPPLPEGVTISTPPQSPTRSYDVLHSLPIDMPSFNFRMSFDRFNATRGPIPSTQAMSATGIGFHILTAGNTVHEPNYNPVLSRAAGNPESDKSTTSTSALEFVRSILPLKENDDFMSPDYIQTICGELRKTMPERFSGELELIVSRLLEPDLEQIVRFAAKRSINGQLSLEKMQHLITIVETTGCDKHVLSCLETGGRAMKCLATAILGAALLNNNDRFIRIALDHGADPNCRVQDERPLSLATREPVNHQLILMLLDAGAKPSNRDIFLAAQRGDIRSVKLLVRKVARTRLGDLVRIAARRGDLELLRSVIKLGGAHTNWPMRRVGNSLHLALLGQHFELARLLIDLEPPNEHLTAYFMLAVKRGDRLAAEFLLQHGVDVNARMRYERQSAFSLSMRYGRKDMIQLLLRYRADPSIDGPRSPPQRQGIGTDGPSIQNALEDAVRSGSIETTQLSLSMGAKAQESDTSSFPLGLAVLESPRLIPILLGACADISSMFEWNSPDSEHKSATMLEVAVESAIVSR
ncbi:hypothetical protein NXS19_004223 [Fusarium pseudograminearum]|nr:hypothetical protein NXS19_004223 [Fusarium pseudograminearum]